MKLSICLATTVSMMFLTQFSSVTEPCLKRRRCKNGCLLNNHRRYRQSDSPRYPSRFSQESTSLVPDDVKVIGGKITSVKENPFVISLLYRPVIDDEEVYFRCGAAIINKHWAVSAAHCLVGTGVQHKMVMAGNVFLRGSSSLWKSPEAKRTDHFIEYYNVHKGYIGAKNNYDYDICILKIKDAFDGPNESPIAFAHRSYKYVENTTATVFGWGTTQKGAINDSPELKKVDIFITNFKHCQREHKKIHKFVTKRMVCAWKRNADSCVGDSGGPLIQNDVLIGIVSWGVECASSRWPGVYTRLSEYYDWISKSIHHYSSKTISASYISMDRNMSATTLSQEKELLQESTKPVEISILRNYR